MRPSYWMTLGLIAAASLSASPTRAQFAAEDAAELPADGDGAYDEVTDDEAGAAVDPYAANPGYETAPPQSIGDRTVADLAAGVLGAMGAQRVQDAEAIARAVIGKAGANGGTPASPGSDPVGLVQDILTATRKSKPPE
jgi:hypothetical protein